MPLARASSRERLLSFCLRLFSQVELSLEDAVCEGEFYLFATSLTRIYVTSNALVWRSSCTEAGSEKRPIS